MTKLFFSINPTTGVLSFNEPPNFGDHLNIYNITITATSTSSSSIQYLTVNILPLITSNICFRKGTRILTDQGKINIENIIPNLNTINNEKIRFITKTINHSNKLVFIKKNALNKNVPNRDLYISMEHIIKYNNQNINAHKFVSMKKAKFVNSENEILYNLIMDKWNFVNANNVYSETLHPTNIMYKIFMTNIYQIYKKRNNKSNISHL